MHPKKVDCKLNRKYIAFDHFSMLRQDLKMSQAAVVVIKFTNHHTFCVRFNVLISIKLEGDIASERQHYQWGNGFGLSYNDLPSETLDVSLLWAHLFLVSYLH